MARKLACVPPTDNVGKPDQPVEQRRDDEGLFTMDLVALAGHLKMLNDGLGADFEYHGRFSCSLPSCNPKQTLPLPIGQGRDLLIELF